jgi:hydrogenase maturation protease
MKIAVIGYGSPLRSDDRAGIDAARKLKKIYRSYNHVEFFEGYTSLDILKLFDKFHRIIIVDAGDINKKPGEFIRLPMQEVKFRKSEFAGFTHALNFESTISLAKKLKMPIPEIVFYLIQPASLDFGEELSKDVSDGMKKLTMKIREEIDNYA